MKNDNYNLKKHCGNIYNERKSYVYCGKLYIILCINNNECFFKKILKKKYSIK